MARWEPKPEIGRSEPIGRRIFEDLPLAGTADQPPLRRLSLNHFLERRDAELSVDRLGRTGVERQVKGILAPLAKRAAESRQPRRIFVGWATVAAKEILSARRGTSFQLIASPIEDETNRNDFHAHVVRPEGMDAHSMALHIREIFESYGAVESEPIPRFSLLERVLSLPFFRWAFGTSSNAQ